MLKTDINETSSCRPKKESIDVSFHAVPIYTSLITKHFLAKKSLNEIKFLFYVYIFY